jgi:NTE family protein
LPTCLALAVCALAGCTEQSAMPAAPGEEPRLVEPGEGAPRPMRWALVLSSGGLRGFAHVGVLQALAGQGLYPDLVVGSSVGAVVGAVYASGRSPGEIVQLVADEGFTLGAGWLRPLESPTQRSSVHEVVLRHLREPLIEHFPTPFAAVVTDLQQGCMTVFNAGAAAIAVQASAGLPGVFAATMIDGHFYADGGLTSPVPVRVARALGAQRVVAVDVTYPPRESDLDGVIGRLFQIGLVMSHALAQQEASEADLVIAPELPASRDIRIGTRMALVAAGARAAQRAAPQLRRLLSAAPEAATGGRLDGDPRSCAQASRRPAGPPGQHRLAQAAAPR